MEKLNGIIKKVLNKEVILYIVFGILTTVVNIVTSYVLKAFFNVEGNIASTIGIIVCVLFAYFTNRKWVFQTYATTIKEKWVEFGRFVLGRAFTMVVEIVEMFPNVREPQSSQFDGTRLGVSQQVELQEEQFVVFQAELRTLQHLHGWRQVYGGKRVVQGQETVSGNYVGWQWVVHMAQRGKQVLHQLLNGARCERAVAHFVGDVVHACQSLRFHSWLVGIHFGVRHAVAGIVWRWFAEYDVFDTRVQAFLYDFYFVEPHHVD